jgi:hypothetical protein
MLVLAVFSAFVVTIADSALQVGAGPTGEAWALSGMSFGLAAALLTAGAMADDLGHGKVLTGSAVLASVVGGLGWRGRRGHHPRDRLRLPHSRQRLAGEAGSG